MQRKKVLIDLSKLKTLNCGLGQVALNYAKYLSLHYRKDCPYEITAIVPKNMVGICGERVHYKVDNQINRYFYRHFARLCKYILPHYDLWHSIHQLSRYRPYHNDTEQLLIVHDFNPIYEKKGKRRAVYFRKLQKELNRATHITAISNFSRNEIAKYFDKSVADIDVIYNGVEWLPTEETQCPSNLPTGDTPFFFTIGQVTEKKNFHTLVEMMRYFPDKQLYIAGENATRYGTFIRKIIADNQMQNVKMLGAVSNEERIWLYQNCEAFLFPSLFEGFGLPVIEAMQFGKPVVSSAETSLKEIGGEYATFFDGFDPQSMANSVTNALQNHTTEKATAEIQYAKSFSYQKHFEKYRQKYDDILND